MKVAAESSRVTLANALEASGNEAGTEGIILGKRTEMVLPSFRGSSIDSAVGKTAAVTIFPI